MRRNPDSNIGRWIDDNHLELKAHTPVNWMFLQLLKDFTFLNSQSDELGKKNFGEKEEIVFEKWNKSEFADIFLKELNRGSYLGKASRKALIFFDEHLVTFGDRHVLRKDNYSPRYRSQTSLGEFERGKKISRLLETTLHIEGKDLNLMAGKLQEMKTFAQRIEAALLIIRRFSPSSWERFCAFTNVIIPIARPEFVSYSHQELPGHSMINLYHRDFVDLMDDLLHENGHHHLNYYLNLGTLIEEPIDNIYYSPWRRTLRPLRGIFHAYFTFFWAFKLFADLADTKDVDSVFYIFSKEEKEKILWRVIEEYYMLNYSFQDLKWARKEGLIYDKGWELILEQQKELRKFSRKIPLWEKKLKAHRKDLTALKKVLKLALRDFKKN